MSVQDQHQIDVLRDAIAALETFEPNSEERAMRLESVPMETLEEHIGPITDALFLAEPTMAMRVLNALPAAFFKIHFENYLAYLNSTSDPGYAAGAFVIFKARSIHRTNLNEWNLDKALWKWMRQTDTVNLEEVVVALGPDWGSLFADHVAIVYGAGRLSKRLHRLAESLRD